MPHRPCCSTRARPVRHVREPFAFRFSKTILNGGNNEIKHKTSEARSQRGFEESIGQDENLRPARKAQEWAQQGEERNRGKSLAEDYELDKIRGVARGTGKRLL